MRPGKLWLVALVVSAGIVAYCLGVLWVRAITPVKTSLTSQVVSQPMTAAVQATDPGWVRYLDAHGNEIIVKVSCLRAEDSAGHLRTLNYAGRDRVVLGCEHKGY